jgi:hypothetical protein
MSTTVYALIETQFEYDDNNYNANGKETVCLYRTQERAQQEAARRTLRYFRTETPESIRSMFGEELRYGAGNLESVIEMITSPIVGVMGEVGSTLEDWGIEVDDRCRRMVVNGEKKIVPEARDLPLFFEQATKWIRVAPDEWAIKFLNHMNMEIYSVSEVELVD